MTETLNKTKVVVELIPDASLITKSIKRQTFIMGKVISVGSEIDYLQPEDIVTLFNEGVLYNSGESKVRIVNDESIVLKHPPCSGKQN